MFRFLIPMFVVISSVSQAFAAEEPMLKPGSPAPKIFASKWLNGEPVAAFEKGKVYVVECWATWCGPCVAAIPHLSELNTRFKDKGVVFIGMNVWQKDTSLVEPFLKSMGAKMNYRVALDDAEGKTAEEWLAAAGKTGIPCSFVVDKEGKIAWIGHPMSGLDGVIAQVAAGTFDLKKQAELEAERKAIQGRMQSAAQSEDIAKFLAAADEMAALDPASAPQMGYAKFNALLQGKKDYAAAYALAGKLLENEWKDDPEMLNGVAWMILDTEGIEKRDFDLALKLAVRADELTKHESGHILDTLARAHFEKGALDKAIEIQTLAVEKVKGDPAEEDVVKALARYKEAKAKVK